MQKKGFAFSPLAIWHRFPGNTICCPIIPLKLHSSSKFIQEIPQRMLRFMWTGNFMNIECVTFFEWWNIQRVYTKYDDRMHVNMMFWPENYSILFLNFKMLRDLHIMKYWSFSDKHTAMSVALDLIYYLKKMYKR